MNKITMLIIPKQSNGGDRIEWRTRKSTSIKTGEVLTDWNTHTHHKVALHPSAAEK